MYGRSIGRQHRTNQSTDYLFCHPCTCRSPHHRHIHHPQSHGFPRVQCLFLRLYLRPCRGKLLDSRALPFRHRLLPARRGMLWHQCPPLPQPSADERSYGSGATAVGIPHNDRGADLLAHGDPSAGKSCPHHLPRVQRLLLWRYLCACRGQLLDGRALPIRHRLLQAWRGLLWHQPPPMPEPSADKCPYWPGATAVLVPHIERGTDLPTHHNTCANQPRSIASARGEQQLLWYGLWRRRKPLLGSDSMPRQSVSAGVDVLHGYHRMRGDRSWGWCHERKHPIPFFSIQFSGKPLYGLPAWRRGRG